MFPTLVVEVRLFAALKQVRRPEEEVHPTVAAATRLLTRRSYEAVALSPSTCRRRLA